MIRVSHVINGLDTGGAEMMLYKLTGRFDRAEFASEVISLTGVGPVGQRIAALGIPVTALGMRRGVPDPRAVASLLRLLRRSRADVVQTWLPHADLLGGIAARLAGIRAVAWGIRYSELDPRRMSRLTMATLRVSALLGHVVPMRILCNSEVARAHFARNGYPAARMQVIPNGFDLARFRPDPAARPSLRRELDLDERAPLVGMIGRWDPMKGHRGMVEVAARLRGPHPDARFILCGDGVTWENRTLAGWIDARGLRDRVRLLGRREDMPRVMAALDVLALASEYGEGFPNVVGEAMACGVPCAVTDVGDAGRLVDGVGRAVPPGDPAALAGAIDELLSLPVDERRSLGEAARRRVRERYDLDLIVARYAALYRELHRAATRSASITGSCSASGSG